MKGLEAATPEGPGNGGPVVQTIGLQTIFESPGGFLKPRVSVRAVDGVTLEIKRGETLALVGESGSGKTTLGRTIIRLIEPTEGKLLYNGLDITHTEEKKLIWLRRKAQIIHQDPYSSVNSAFPIYKVLGEPLAIHNIGTKEERTNLVYRALESVKLSPPDLFAQKYPHMLSGGQRQRVAVARAMILEPEFIVADEPVSMLDASVRISILKLLRELQHRFHIAFLYVTHDLATARHFSDRIGIMYAGKLVEEGPVGSVLKEPLHPYTQALMNALPDPDPENRLRVRTTLPGEPPSLTDPPPGCRFHPRCPIAKLGLCDIEEPPLRELRPNHQVACHLAV